MFSLEGKHPPIPGGRYYEDGKWVDANGNDLDPDVVSRKLEEQIAELTERLSNIKTTVSKVVEKTK